MRCAGEQHPPLRTGALTTARNLRGRQRHQVAAALAQRFTHDQVPIRDLAAQLDWRPSLIRWLLHEAGVLTEDTTCVGMTPAADR